MGISEEEQMKAMLAEMGMSSIDELDEGTEDFRPIPEGPVSAPKSEPEASPLNVAEELENPQSEVNLAPESIGRSTVSSESSPLTSSQHRDLPVSALLHLMGLPTGSQINVLDNKLDLVLTKLVTLQAQIDRMNSQFELLSATSATERLEFQVSEIRSIMKKFFPQAFSGSVNQTSTAKAPVVKTPVVVQSSEPSPVSTEKKETSVHVDVGSSEIEEYEPLSDEDYQAQEAQKLRDQVNKDTKQGQ